jgi:predicted nucleotidyltransferase
MHEHAAEAIVDFFLARPQVDAVLLVNSCARGIATPDSDLDIAVLVAPKLDVSDQAALEHRWQTFYNTHEVFQRLRRPGRFTGVRLDLIDR